MTKTKLLLTGLITGAMAFGVACRTDQTASRTTTPTSTQDTGGSGNVTNRTRGEGMTPMPEENGTREMEPEVHENPTSPPPDTGGSGLDPQPIDKVDKLDKMDKLPPETNVEPQPNTTDSMPKPVQ